MVINPIMTPVVNERPPTNRRPRPFLYNGSNPGKFIFTGIHSTHNSVLLILIATNCNVANNLHMFLSESYPVSLTTLIHNFHLGFHFLQWHD